MGVLAKVARAAVNTSTGTQNFTTTSLGGLTPKAVQLTMTSALADGSPVAGLRFSYGVATGVGDEWVRSWASDDNLSTSNVRFSGNGDQTHCIRLIDGDGAILAEGEFSAWITNGVTIDWTTAPAAAYLLTVLLFAGSDLSAHAAVQTVTNTQDAVTSVTAPGFKPDALVTASNVVSTANSGAHSGVSLGFVYSDGVGGVTQRALFWSERDNLTTTKLGMGTHDGGGIVQYGATTTILDVYIEFGGFNANGFDMTERNAGGNSRKMGYLALAFGGVVEAKLITHSTPTSTGSVDETGFGWKPQAVLALATFMETINVASTTANNESLMVAAWDEDGQYANSVNSVDNVSTTDAQSLSDDVALKMPDGDGSAGITATLTGFIATGAELDYTNVEASAKLIFMLGIEEDAGASDDLTASDTEAQAPVVGAPSIGQTHVLASTDTEAQAPVAGASSIGQTHVLASQDTEAQAPVVDASSIGQTHVLASADTEAQAPVAGASSIGQTHVLASMDTEAQAPVVDSTALGQTHVLASTDTEAQAPVMGSPVLAEEHALTSTDTEAQAPVVGAPSIGQTHVLASTDTESQAPVVGSPSLDAEVTHDLTASDTEAQAPVVGASALGQTHVLASADTEAQAPVVGASALGQAHVLSSADTEAQAPVVGSAVLGQGHVLSAAITEAQAPVVGAPSMGQTHLLATSDTVAGLPEVGAPNLSRILSVGVIVMLIGSAIPKMTITSGTPGMSVRTLPEEE